MPQRVLLVDDDENLLRGLARALRHQPYHLYTARSADEAMLILKSRPIDLVLADHWMPGMNGTELLTWVAKHLPHVKRFLITGAPTVQAAISAINDAGVERLFTKPCDPVELAFAIHKALEMADKADSVRQVPKEAP